MKLNNHRTVIGAARQLGVHPSTIYVLIRTGKLSAAKVGRTWQISIEALDAYVRQATRKPEREVSYE